MQLNQLSAVEIARLTRSGEISVEQVVDDCLAHIAAREPVVKAWAVFNAESALRQARDLDRNNNGVKGPLHGVPVGVKDVIDTFDMRTEMGSPIYAGHQPRADAACVALVRAAGAVILVKPSPPNSPACFRAQQPIRITPCTRRVAHRAGRQRRLPTT